MNKFIRWFSVLCACEMCTLSGYAQNPVAKIVPIALTGELPASAGSFLSGTAHTAIGEQIALSLQREISQAQWEQEQIKPALLKMESSLIQGHPQQDKFHANAFLIETTYKGKREVWGVTAAELLHGYGTDLILRTEIGGQKIAIPAQAVVQGPFALSNIALLKIPQALPAALKPLKLARSYDFGQPVSLFGYRKGKFSALQNLELQKDNGLFMRMNFEDIDFRQSMPFGGPVLSQGKLVGVYCNRSLSGGYASSIRALPFLIEAAHEGTTEFPLQMQYIFFGTIRPTEVILSVEALDYRFQVLGRKIIQKELHQSDVFKLFNNPDTRFIRFVIEDRKGNIRSSSPKNNFRMLTYDKDSRISWSQKIEPTHLSIIKK